MNPKIARVWSAFFLVLPLVAMSAAAAAAADSRLVNAVTRQDRAAVRTLIKEGVDVNAPLGDGSTPLSWAAHRGNADIVDMLLQAKANVNAADDHGVTPLALACENADAAIVDKLLGAGANANAVQTNGVTPLMIAARTGNVPIVKALLAKGADVNRASGTKQTALMWAIGEQSARDRPPSARHEGRCPRHVDGRLHPSSLRSARRRHRSGQDADRGGRRRQRVGR